MESLRGTNIVIIDVQLSVHRMYGNGFKSRCSGAHIQGNCGFVSTENGANKDLIRWFGLYNMLLSCYSDTVGHHLEFVSFVPLLLGPFSRKSSVWFWAVLATT